MPMRILAAADLHIGRRPSQVAPALAESFSGARAWRQLVRYAVSEQVSAVLLAGDLVDEGNKFFEALGPFEQGLRELAAAAIPVLAVAGNHDFDVLAQLADSLADAGFQLVGQGGQWERVLLTAADGAVLQVVGWSFPSALVSRSPLREFSASAVGLDPALPAVGLLHADLDASTPSYAPVKRSEFAASGIGFWILGHLHSPVWHRAGAGMPALLYPGSLQGMDPGSGETGPHGPWIIEFGGGQAVAKHLALAGLVYDDLAIRLDNCHSSADVRQQLASAIRQHVQDLQAATRAALEAVCLRLSISGRTELKLLEVKKLVEEAVTTGMAVAQTQVQLRLHALALRPRLDIKQLTSEPTLPGELARLILALDPDNDAELPGTGELLDQLAAALRNIRSAATFRLLDDASLLPVPSRQECRALALEQAWQLLEVLCQQREQGGENV